MTTKTINYSPWPKIIISFFLVVATFNGWLLYQAIDKRSARVTPDAYSSGIKYQEVIDQENNLKVSGLKPEININCNEACQIQIQNGMENTARLSKEATLALLRPEDNSLDMSVNMQLSDRGIYTFQAPQLKEGQWLFSAKYSVDNQPVIFRGRVWVR